MRPEIISSNSKLSNRSPSPQDGSIELVVLGMLAALIVVLAIPLFIDGPAERARIEQGSEQETEQSNPAAEILPEIKTRESALQCTTCST